MTLVMTLLARDEADVIESWLSFHLNAGADFVVATDNRSQDGTTDVLERYEREGRVHLIREDGEDLRQNEWVTRMARLAATDFGADWVINSDADEFWWPRGASLSTVLEAIPPRYGAVGAFLRTFAPRPDSHEPFAERQTVRFSALAPINDPASLYKPIRKVIHRGHPEIQLTRGNHALVDSPFDALRGWFPVEVLHFPLRSLAQCEHKARLQGSAWQHIERTPTAYHAQMFEALADGRIAEYYDAQVITDDEIEQGVASGRL
ncbi:MAG: glycosyltransferase family 2 protein, partial [Gaiellaceae bacterium]